MINHASSVRLGTKKAILVVDMPYNTYRNSKMALKNAKIIMSKTKCDAVKLEGGKSIIPTIKTLIKIKYQLWVIWVFYLKQKKNLFLREKN
jgi:3-methyl-2-oxobutanoate hydroxymethyltransferase